MRIFSPLLYNRATRPSADQAQFGIDGRKLLTQFLDQAADGGNRILACCVLEARGRPAQVERMNVGAGAFQRMRALAHGVEVADFKSRDDLRKALIAAAHEGL